MLVILIAINVWKGWIKDNTNIKSARRIFGGAYLRRKAHIERRILEAQGAYFEAHKSRYGQ